MLWGWPTDRNHVPSLTRIVVATLVVLAVAASSAAAELPAITDATGPILPTGPSPSAQPRGTGDVVFRFDPERLGGPSRLEASVTVNPGVASVSFRVPAAPADSTYTVTVLKHGPDSRIGPLLGPGEVVSVEQGHGNAGTFTLDLPPTGALLDVRVTTLSASSDQTLSGTVQVLAPPCALLYPVGGDYLPTDNVCATGSGEPPPPVDRGKPVGALALAVEAYTSGTSVAPSAPAPATTDPGTPRCPGGASPACSTLDVHPAADGKGLVVVVTGTGWDTSEDLARMIRGVAAGPPARATPTVQSRPRTAKWPDGLRALGDQLRRSMPVCVLGVSSGPRPALTTAFLGPDVTCAIGDGPPTSLLLQALPAGTAQPAM